MTVCSYLNLILITLNFLCKKVTAIYTLPPYIFLKENGILVKTAMQKTEVCSFLLAHKNMQNIGKNTTSSTGLYSELGREGTTEFNLLCSRKPFCFWKSCQNRGQQQQRLKKSIYLFQRCNQTPSQDGFEP